MLVYSPVIDRPAAPTNKIELKRLLTNPTGAHGKGSRGFMFAISLVINDLIRINTLYRVEHSNCGIIDRSRQYAAIRSRARSVKLNFKLGISTRLGRPSNRATRQDKSHLLTTVWLD